MTYIANMKSIKIGCGVIGLILVSCFSEPLVSEEEVAPKYTAEILAQIERNRELLELGKQRTHSEQIKNDEQRDIAQNASDDQLLKSNDRYERRIRAIRNGSTTTTKSVDADQVQRSGSSTNQPNLIDQYGLSKFRGNSGDHITFYIAAADSTYKTYKQSGLSEMYDQHKKYADLAKKFHERLR